LVNITERRRKFHVIFRLQELIARVSALGCSQKPWTPLVEEDEVFISLVGDVRDASILDDCNYKI